MRKILTVLSAALFLAACSTPKYTYHFDHYDYNSGKKTSPSNQLMMITDNPVQESLIDETTLVASANEQHVYVAEAPTNISTRKEIAEKIKALSKEERKELKKEIKKYVKGTKKIESVSSTASTTSLSGDVKLAAIFGAIGIVLLIIGGSVLYIIGAVSLLVGLYFLIRYLAHP